MTLFARKRIGAAKTGWGKSRSAQTKHERAANGNREKDRSGCEFAAEKAHRVLGETKHRRDALPTAPPSGHVHASMALERTHEPIPSKTDSMFHRPKFLNKPATISDDVRKLLMAYSSTSFSWFLSVAIELFLDYHTSRLYYEVKYWCGPFDTKY